MRSHCGSVKMKEQKPEKSVEWYGVAKEMILWFYFNSGKLFWRIQYRLNGLINGIVEIFTRMRIQTHLWQNRSKFLYKNSKHNTTIVMSSIHTPEMREIPERKVQTQNNCIRIPVTANVSLCHSFLCYHICFFLVFLYIHTCNYYYYLSL